MFTPIHASNFIRTREQLQAFANVLAALREVLTPPAAAWTHISLHIGEHTIETPPMPFANNNVLAIRCDNLTAEVRDETRAIVAATSLAALSPQSLLAFFRTVLPDTATQLESEKFSAEEISLDGEVVRQIHSILYAAAQVFGETKQELGGKEGGASAVQLWSHHFDLAFNWYKETYIDENAPMIYHGLSLGDDEHPQPYFSVYVYPWPENFKPVLPANATLHTEGWKGVVLDYTAFAATSATPEMLGQFLRDAHYAMLAAL
ncbi:MAG: hypothetical protein IAF08_02645 [Rhizobacter sp.]|nr:hypothetical protein [Chlorobiales bacterium]